MPAKKKEKRWCGGGCCTARLVISNYNGEIYLQSSHIFIYQLLCNAMTSNYFCCCSCVELANIDTSCTREKFRFVIQSVCHFAFSLIVNFGSRKKMYNFFNVNSNWLLCLVRHVVNNKCIILLFLRQPLPTNSCYFRLCLSITDNNEMIILYFFSFDDS